MTTKQAKNYFGFLNDESGSMNSLKAAALADYNANIGAVKGAATKYEQDTIVSMTTFGSVGFNQIDRAVVNSNPHVLKEQKVWRASGSTPMFAALLDMISQLESLPDANESHVSFTVLATTDGQATDRGYRPVFAEKVKELNSTGRWTFVFRVPRGGREQLDGLNIPAGNIQEWDTTTAGMAESTAKTTAAVDTFFATRATGKTSSTVFYADASAVTAKAVASKLVDVSKDVSLYVVPASDNGIEIKPFILRHRMEYLKGSAFYQLTKTESKVSHTKLIAIRDRVSGVIYSGDEARNMIGLPTGGNARLHPGNHGNFDIFIQSDSINRKLVGGTGVLYWAKIGRPFTEADLAYLNRPAAPVVPAIVELPKVAPTNKPTKSPIPVTPKGPMVNGRPVQFFDNRRLARATGKSVQDLANFQSSSFPGAKRWFVFI